MTPGGAGETEVLGRLAGRSNDLVTFQGGDLLRPPSALKIAQPLQAGDLKPAKPIPHQSATGAQAASDVLDRPALGSQEDHSGPAMLSDLATLPPKYLLEGLALRGQQSDLHAL